MIVHAAAQPSPRPRGGDSVRRLRHQRRRHAEPARGRAPRAVPRARSSTCARTRCTATRPTAFRLTELETRWDYADPAFAHGIPETFTIDQSMHWLFGASKVAADVMVQEYGRYFGMPTCCLRGGCLTGPESQRRRAARLPQLSGEVQSRGSRVPDLRLQGQAGPRQHPLPRRRPLHPRVRRGPRVGEVYNLGGGKANSCSILEAFAHRRRHHRAEAQRYTYVDDEPRRRSHLLLQRPSQDARALSGWDITVTLEQTIARDRRGLAAEARFVKILVTGACGFVGSTLIRGWVKQRTHDLLGLDNFIRPGSEQNRAALRALGVPSVTPTSASPPTSRRCPPCDAVIDAAANPSVLAGVDGRHVSRGSSSSTTSSAPSTCSSTAGSTGRHSSC